MVEYIAIAVVVIVLLVVIILAAKRRCRSGKKGSCKSPKNRSKRPSYNGPANTQLYVGNVSYRANESELREFFAGFGDVETVRVIKDRRTGRSKGFAFITFSDLDSASAALDAHEKDFAGRALIVRYAKPASR